MSKKKASRIGMFVGLIVGFVVSCVVGYTWYSYNRPTPAAILICGGLIAAGAFMGALIGVIVGDLSFTIFTKLKKPSGIGLVVGLIVGLVVGYVASYIWDSNTYMPTPAGILICCGLIAAGASIGAVIGALSGALIFTIVTKLNKS